MRTSIIYSYKCFFKCWNTDPSKKKKKPNQKYKWKPHNQFTDKNPRPKKTLIQTKEFSQMKCTLNQMQSTASPTFRWSNWNIASNCIRKLFLLCTRCSYCHAANFHLAGSQTPEHKACGADHQTELCSDANQIKDVLARYAYRDTVSCSDNQGQRFKKQKTLGVPIA